VLGLSRLSPAPRQHAQQGRDPHGHRGDLFAEVEIQGVLDPDPRGAGREAELKSIRSFPRRRESSSFFSWLWVPAFAGTSGRDQPGTLANISLPYMFCASAQSGCTAFENAACSSAVSSAISQP